MKLGFTYREININKLTNPKYRLKLEINLFKDCQNYEIMGSLNDCVKTILLKYFEFLEINKLDGV